MTTVRRSSGQAATANQVRDHAQERPLADTEKRFLKELLRTGEMSLRTAAFGFGTGGAQSLPARLGLIRQDGAVPDDLAANVRLTPEGVAFAKKLR